ncbi:MAG TPA: ABC transporter permease [Paenalcaligenes sp.]|nr:ABC transporter permease [Paenalcaligenes sp.]HLR82688.1 ABC transporter permease [Paenalcaligenes sp.]
MTTRQPPAQDTPQRQAMLRTIRSRPSTKRALLVLGLIIAVVMVAPFFAPQNPYDLLALDIMDGRLPPGSKSFEGMPYWLGTDSQGRDMFSAILYGLRISLFVGLTSVVFSVMIGVTLGLIAAYHGGWLDSLIMRFVDFILGFPTILVALVLLAALGRGIDKVIIALVIVQWAHYARIMRGRALQERRKEYIEAASNLGFSSWRIIFRHLMPNCFGPIMVFATIQIANAIILEATLSFLGVGVPITEPSLGLLIASGFEYLLSGDYWISIFPGIALLLLILSINIIGDRLRISLDPRR